MSNQDAYSANPQQKVYDLPHSTDHQVEVIEIYFGKKVLTPVYEETEEEFAAKKGETVAKAKTRFLKEKNIKAKDLLHFTPEKNFKAAAGGEKIKAKYKKKVKDQISFDKVKKTKIKKKIWIVAFCSGSNGKLTVTLHENKGNNTEAVYDDPVKFLLGDVEATKIEFDLAADLLEAPNIYGKEIKLQPKSDADIKKLIEKFEKRTDKNAFLYLKGAVSDLKPDASGQADKVIFPDNTHEFRNKDKEWLEVLGTPCYCGVDFTVEEVRSFIKQMREDEKILTMALFSDENCPISAEDKTYERLTEELNKMMKKYYINTCIRKIHFLAQSYHESSRYGTTLEYKSGEKYNPGKHSNSTSMEHTVDGDGPRYKGRGIIQMTWRKTQKKYLTYALEQDPGLSTKTIDEMFDRTAQYKEKYIHYEPKLDAKGNQIINPKTNKPIKEKIVDEVGVDSASLIARNIHLAFDSAGWYWENMGNVTATGENINKVADTDDVLQVSQCINGNVDEPYGLAERKIFTKSLKTLFDYDDQCINKKKKQAK